MLEPTAGLFDVKDCSTGHDFYSTTRHFLNRILNSPVAIGGQQLHKLQQYGAT